MKSSSFGDGLDQQEEEQEGVGVEVMAMEVTQGRISMISGRMRREGIMAREEEGGNIIRVPFRTRDGYGLKLWIPISASDCAGSVPLRGLCALPRKCCP